MSFLSGKDGTLYLGDEELTPVTRWRLERRCAARSYVANDTGGARRRLPGARDASGTVEIVATDSGHAPVEEGDEVLLKLHLDRSGSNYLDVPAVIDRVRMEVEISEGRIVGFTVEFSGNGPVVAHGVLAKE